LVLLKHRVVIAEELLMHEVIIFEHVRYDCGCSWQLVCGSFLTANGRKTDDARRVLPLENDLLPLKRLSGRFYLRPYLSSRSLLQLGHVDLLLCSTRILVQVFLMQSRKN
jgi:hypothetical protein